MVSGVDPAALRAAREAAGLTQHELARLVGAAGGERISRWELGTSTPRPDFLAQLSAVLNIPTIRLIALDGDAPDIKALRLQAGLSVPEVAARVPIAVPTYYAWEQGRWTRLPSPVSLRGLANALKVSTDVLEAAFDQARRQRSARSAEQD